MPRAEERKVPKGQEYGKATAQQQFVQQTQPGDAAPPGSMIQLPEAGPAMAGPEADLLGPLLAPTERPDEPVFPRQAPRRKLSELYGELLAASGGAPDVAALLDMTQQLGL